MVYPDYKAEKEKYERRADYFEGLFNDACDLYRKETATTDHLQTELTKAYEELAKAKKQAHDYRAERDAAEADRNKLVAAGEDLIERSEKWRASIDGTIAALETAPKSGNNDFDAGYDMLLKHIKMYLAWVNSGHRLDE